MAHYSSPRVEALGVDPEIPGQKELAGPLQKETSNS